MTYSDLAERRAVLQSHRVTAAQSAVLQSVGLGHSSPDLIPRQSCGPDYSFADPATEDECRTALRQCLAHGWLQIIDADTLAEIRDGLRRSGVLGPIYGLPGIGDVDITYSGLDLRRRMSTDLRSLTKRPVDAVDFAYTDAVEIRTVLIGRGQEAIDAWLRESRDPSTLAEVSPSQPIAAWRAEWWRIYESGVCLRVTERMQYEGRCGEHGGIVHAPAPKLRLEDKHAREVLDECNIDRREWLVLHRIATAGPTFSGELEVAPGRWESATAEVTAQEMSGIVAACLRKGWLRRLDFETHAAISRVFADGIVLAALEPPRCDRELLDFTPDGAMVYGIIAPELYGPDWDAGIIVERETYRREFRYARTRAGIERALADYHASDEPVLSCRGPFEIGPWCVWWQTIHPDGYAAEVEIGQPADPFERLCRW